MRNILITGGAGFIGSNFINIYKLSHPDDYIVNIDKLDYCSNKDNIDHDIFIHANITDQKNMLNILKQYNIDIIIHFAAQTHVDNSFGNSIQFTQDNILGTHSLLEACRKYNKIKKFIHVSTDEVYGEVSINESCSEKSILNPTNPYAATKCGAEFLVRSYYYSFKLPITIVRGNNVYGPRQYNEKVIPRFITNLLQNKKCQIQGNGSNKRNFIHVNDFNSAIIKILERGKIVQIYNIGTTNEYSVNEIADLLIKRLKPSDSFHDWVEYVEDRNFNDSRYSVNSDKLIELGWNEKISFTDGINSTIEWYMKNITRKWLILGRNGWVGKQVNDILRTNNEYVIDFDSNIRVDNEKEMEELIVNTHPDRIICLIGRTHGSNINSIDYLEQKGKLIENVRDNLYAPFILAELCKKYNIHLTYLGTGCIFSGYDKKYTENDEPDFFGSSYSVIKGFTDRIMKFYDNVLNIRIRMPITDELFCNRNFIYKITHYKKICNMPNSMSVLPELIPIMIDMSIHKRTGTINLTNPNKISHNEILEMYKQIVDPNFRWTNFNVEEQNKILASERSNNELSSDKLLHWYPNIKSIHDSVKDILYSMKRQKEIIDSRYRDFKSIIETLYDKYVILRTQNILCVENDFFIGNNIYDYSLKDIQTHTINTLFIKLKVLNIGIIYLRNIFGNELFSIIKDSEMLINISRPIITFVDTLDNILVLNFLQSSYYDIYYINDNNYNKQFITIPNEKNVNLLLECLVKL